MKLEDQVCSLDLAKRLKGLGAKQEAFFWWSENTSPATLWRHDALGERDDDYEREYAAFTVAELGEMLPQLEIRKQWWVPVSYQFAGTSGYRCELVDRKMMELGYGVMGLTEADARAKMLIYLIENKLITV